VLARANLLRADAHAEAQKSIFKIKRPNHDDGERSWLGLTIMTKEVLDGSRNHGVNGVLIKPPQSKHT
jgi:hypothetical protein